MDQHPRTGVRHRPPRAPRADQPGPDRGAGDRARRADAEVHGPSDRPQPPVRGRHAARRPPPPRRAAGDLPWLLGRQHPQVRRPSDAPVRARRARHADAVGGALPRGLRAGGPQHPGHRRHPGGQDDDAQLPGSVDPRRGAGDLGRGGLRDQVRPPGLGRPPDPPGGPGGHGRGAGARPRQGVAAHAAEPADRGGGAGRGVPRPVAGAATPGFPACAPCTPTARARR